MHPEFAQKEEDNGNFQQCLIPFLQDSNTLDEMWRCLQGL